MAELPTIIDEIVETLTALSTPTGAAELRSVTGDPPANLGPFPMILILDEAIDLEESAGAGTTYEDYRIGVHLLMSPYSAPRGVGQRRLWLKPIVEAFNTGTERDLDSAVDAVFVTEVTFEPLEWNGVEYIQARFQLDILGVT